MKNENGQEKSAILKGSTKYRDIDTEEFLETFEEGRNLELVSVKIPVLTTTGKNLLNPNWQLNTWYPINLKTGTRITLSTKDGVPSEGGNILFKATDETDIWMGINAGATSKSITLQKDVYKISNKLAGNLKYQLEIGYKSSYEPYKSNILTVNEDIELRAIGDVKDELNVVNGELTQRIKEVVFDGSENWIIGGTSDNYKLFRCESYNDMVKSSNVIISDKYAYSTLNNVGSDLNITYSTTTGKPCIVTSQVNLSLNDFKSKLSVDKPKVLYQLAEKVIKTVDLNILDQDNQPQDRMKIYPSGYINTSSSTFPPILELKGIAHNNKLNMTTTNGVYTNNVQSLTNPVLDGIVCYNGKIVRDSYDVESGLYTKRIFRFTVDEKFIEKYRNDWYVTSNTVITQFRLMNNVLNFPKTVAGYGCNNNLPYVDANTQCCFVTNAAVFYIKIFLEELISYDIDGLLDWIKRNGAIEVAYEMATPQIIHMQPNMTPYISTRPYQGEINSQGNILESSYLDYTTEQSIISPKPLGTGDVLRWEQGSQCYVYENDKEYIPLTDYNQPMGTVLDLEEEDGEQFVENLDGGDIIVDVPFKEKAVYERHLVPHEDKVIYPTQDKLDPTGKIEVDYICGATWQNPNDLSDIRHLGTLRDDGQYDVTIRRSGDDEIRLFDGTTHISLDGDGLNPSEFELTYFNKGGAELGKYGDTSHTLENCVLDSKLETGMVYGDTLVNLLDTKLFYNSSSTVTRDSDGWITVPGNGNYVLCRHTYQGNLKTDTLYTLIVDVKSNTCSGRLTLVDSSGGGNAESAFTIYGYSIASKATGRFIQTLTTKSDLSGVKCDFRGVLSNSAKTGESIVFRYMLLEGDYTSYPTTIPYFEGVGSTVVNGFTTTNEDETQSITYNLPSPITLNKVGDVADTFDVVSGVETRKIEKVILDGSWNWREYKDDFTTTPNHVYIEVLNGISHPTNRMFTILSPATLTYQEDIWDKAEYVNDNIISLSMPTLNESKCQLYIPKSFLGGTVSFNSVKQYLNDNPIELWYERKTPKTIQHTLIPSSIQTTQEPTFILPQPLRSVPNGICDRLYWDENKGHYCIEKRISEVILDGSDDEKINHNKDYMCYVPMSDGMSFGEGKYAYATGYEPTNYSGAYVGNSNLVAYGYNSSGAKDWLSFMNRNAKTAADFKNIIKENPITAYYPLKTPEIIDLPHLNRKLKLPSQPDILPIGYRAEHPKTNPQLGLTIPYKQLNNPKQPQNIDFKMDIADYVLTWDDVKEARQYNIILNDKTIATVKEPQWNSGEEMYGYILVEAQNELGENLSEELYIKTVPNAPAQLTVAHNPMTNYYDFEISFIKTSAIAEYYTVQYRVDGGEWVIKNIPSEEIDPNSKVLWDFSVFEINKQIEVWATATNEIGTNDILPIATYYMSPTPQWTYRINTKELFVRWIDESPYDTQYKLRYQYKSDGIYRYAYFEGDKQEIGKLYEALIPLAQDEEITIALCVISEKENLYTKPIKASKELDPNIKPPKNFNYRWLARGLIEFYWEDNYDVDVQYEAIVEHRLSGETTWTQDTRLFDSTDVAGVGTVYRLQYQLTDLEEIRVKVRMIWAMNETEWTESLTTVFIPVEGNPPQWIRRTQTKDGLLVEWEAQQYVDSYHVYVMSNGEELQHLETQDNFVLVDIDYSNTIDIEIYEVSRFTGGIEADPSDSMCFRPTMDKQQLIGNFYTPDLLRYELEIDTVQKNQKARTEIHDINVTPNVKSKDPLDISISTPFVITYHPLQLDVHQSGAKAYGQSELHIKTLDVKSRNVVEVLTFERVTDQYGVDFTVYTPSASKYPITLEVNRVRIVCFGDSKLRSVC